MNKICLVASGFCLVSSLAAPMISSAAILTTSYLIGTTVSVPLIADWSTKSADMNGMLVTVSLNGQANQTYTWGSGFNGGVSVGDTSDGWRLYMQNTLGNTLDTPFVLEAYGNADILSLSIFGLPGKTVFDVEPRIGDVSTTGSRDGVPFALSYVDAFGDTQYPVTHSGINVGATYSNLVKLDSSLSPVGDLYTTLSLSFTNTTGTGFSGFNSGSILTFISDTDNAANNPVPEPATLILLGIGLAPLAVRGLRKSS